MKWTGILIACVAMMANAGGLYAAPATQPAPTVLVLPFSAMGDPAAPVWMGKAIQQNLLADLAHARLQPGDEKQPATDAETARVAGQKARARFVIFGTYQTVDQMVRFNGQVIDVTRGAVVGGMTETGSPRDLFAVEDALSDQAIHTLRQLTAPPAKPAVNVPAVPAAPTVADNRPLNIRPYEGSELEAYLNSNRTPSTDYWDQYRQSNNRRAYQYDYSYGNYSYPYYGFGPYFGYSSAYPTYGYTGFGYGTPFAYVRARPLAPIYFSTDHTSH